MSNKTKKLLILNLPYFIAGLVCTNLGEAWRIAEGADMSEKLLGFLSALGAAFSNPMPSLHPLDLLIGVCCGAGMRLAVYLKGKNAKKYRHGMEYGSARWGTQKDIEPFEDPVFANNVILTRTERLMMGNRPKNPANARNKNVLVVGGSGSGKTRFWLKPNLLQCHSSYVVTDPKGDIVIDCGQALLKNGYSIRIFNTINFRKSMHYNPFAYIHSEKDILKLTTTLIANTKGDGKAGDEFWTKAETLLYCALIGYIHYEAPLEEQNFATLIEFLNAMEVREDDETFQNPVDQMFEALKKKKPNHFAVRQYAKFKLAAGKTLKSILVSCGARLAPFDIEEVRDITMYDELSLDTVGDKKTALFLIMSDTDPTFNFLISMIYTQLFNLLCEKADDVYGGRLPVHVRCLIDECANIGQIPNLEKLVATIRSREISACLVLQAQSQLKAIYKDNADTIIGNMDSRIFLGGSEPTTLKELNQALGKETIDLYNTSDTRGNSPSYGTNYQKVGHDLASVDELAVLDGGKCILQLRGVRPFKSDKSMFVVPNHLTLQWANEFLRLYPSAKLLVASKKDFETARRKKFCARIATGDYDAVIIGHSQFEKIPVSAERQERILTAQIDEIENAIAEMKSQNGERFSIKQMEKTRKGLEARLEKLRATDRKDDVITFEQLGVDRLFVDEAHAFKNLFLYTKMRNVAGLSTSEAQKSSDMFMKCQYMDELTGGRGIIFATGTPVSNSMTELYTMMRYLQYGTLQQKGLTHFDSWASTFGETTTAIELAPEGTGYRARTRFAKFFNLPELMNMFKEVADIKTSDQLHLPVPEAKFETVVVQPSEHQQAMVAELSERAAAVHSGVVDPSVDNMLKITSDGRKLGLDQRLMNPLLPDDPNSKLNACVRNVLRIYEEGQSDKLTQLLFCDLSTPKNDGTFNVYEDIRAKLIQSGVPEEEIAFIHDADTEAKKKDLFAKVRTGQVRVLLGSTQKMGAGTNVQDRLVAVHHLDVGWRPADMTQRNGRIIRQGNRNKEVQVYQYVTEGTFDAYLYQTLENKQKFISQIMTSKSPVRSCDDVDEQALSYAEIKALCAGDPQIKEKMDLDVDVARLKVLRADHQSQQYRLEDKLMKYFPAEIEKTQGFIKGFQSDIRTVAAHPLPEEGFCGMEVNGTQFTEKAEAGEAILAVCKANQSLEPVPLGSYRGFKMELTFDSFQKEYQVLLKGEMTHRVPIGTSAAGNIQRLDNALAGIPARLEKAEQQLDNLRSQQEAAQAELGKPFSQEAELAEKSARLAELDALLNMDDRGNDDPDREKTTEKPSVLAELRDRAGRIPPMTHRDDEEVAL